MALASCWSPASDIWLNTPLPPSSLGHQRHEGGAQRRAQLSVLDGWWVEACVDGVTGWAIGDGRRRRRRSDDARRPVRQAGAHDPAAVSTPTGALALDDEAGDRQYRLLLQQPAHDAPLRRRGVPGPGANGGRAGHADQRLAAAANRRRPSARRTAAPTSAIGGPAGPRSAPTGSSAPWAPATI